MSTAKTYIAIDLKSFFASVECVERGLDPLSANLVVADPSRTDKTICLAVSPALKAYGIGGRARLFEARQRIREVNAIRRSKAPGGKLRGISYMDDELKAHEDFQVDFIIAPPRMALYVDYSSRIYSVYLRYIAPEDIHVYSIDEIFCDATSYLRLYGLSPEELARRMILDVLRETGITATAGIGENLYLSKVAMDIVAKHLPPDENGVRIASLTERSYRELLWDHQPLTSFWRVGPGVAARLATYGMHTMGQVARMSLENEDLLYELLGVQAELLIDHAWGWEPCTMKEIKAYRPSSSSICQGQVLQEPYDIHKARVVIREMAENLSLELLEKHLLTDQIVLDVGYDRTSLENPDALRRYKGALTQDRYGRRVPKPAHGTRKLSQATNSRRHILEAVTELFDKVTNPLLLVRHFNLTAARLQDEDGDRGNPQAAYQMELFEDAESQIRQIEEERAFARRERDLQKTVLDIKRRFGKNAILSGLNYEEGATQRDRNQQIGGHKA